MRGEVATRWGAGPREEARVRVLAADRALLDGVEPRLADHLQRTVTAPLIPTRRNQVLGSCLVPDGALGCLVLDGLLSRRSALAGRTSLELVGRGDVIRPWQRTEQTSMLRGASAWSVITPSRLAVIDGDVVASLARVPSVLAALFARATECNHALSQRLAIVQMPRLQIRLLTLLWHLAERWGRVEPQAMVLPLALSHSALGELVGAQRPSVSVALARLVAESHLRHDDDGCWHLLTRPEVFLPSDALAKAGAARRRAPRRPAIGVKV